MRKILAPLVALLCMGGLAQAEDRTMMVNGKEVPAFVDGEVIVKYKEGASRTFTHMVNAYSRVNVVNVQRFSGAFKEFEHLTFDTSTIGVEQVISDLERDPAIEYVQPNYMLYAYTPERQESSQARETLCAIPGVPFPLGCSDETEVSASAVTVPGKGRRPGIKAPPAAAGRPIADPSLSRAWGLKKIGATSAWSTQKGSKSVIVAVIDSGVDYNHPDLAANIWRNPRYRGYKTTGVDAAGTSITGDLVGWDFVHNDNLPYDESRHGTHVAGTIGAVGSNGKGISGVSQRVSIMAVKFLNGQGSGSTSAAIKAIDYAVSRGAKILNNSWGGRGPANRALQDAVARSERAGVLFVAAAGNDGSDNDSRPAYPASYTSPNVLTVASTTSTDALSSFSNRGARSVHIAAPGSSIYSTVPGGGYSTMSGTSMAAPHVSGAAALLWAQNPRWTYREIKDRLINTGDALSSLRGRVRSGRRINVLRALR